MRSIRSITLRPLAIVISLGLAACSGMSSRDQSTAIGAGAGAIGGAVVGGVIGHEIKK